MMTKRQFVVSVLLISKAFAQSAIHITFIRDTVCPDYCNFVYSKQTSLQCARKCSNDPNCNYWAWDPNPGLCKLCQTTLMANSSSMGMAALPVYRKQCANGGTPKDNLHTCSCLAGFAGDFCQRLIYDCSEGFDLNYPTGIYRIQTALASSPVSVYCDLKWGGRTYIARRSGPDLLFNRTWDEYRDGFGNVEGDYWLGLQNIYLLTTGGSNSVLLIEIKNSSDHYYKQYYNNVEISDETSHYQLQFSSTRPDSDPQHALGDSLSPALGSRFSTYDADHDGDDNENCALRHQSGWWFPSPCNLTEGNPLGRLARPSDEVWSGNPEDIFWLNNLGNMAPYEVYMAIVNL